MSVSDRLLLRKRAIIEAVNDELKNIAQVEHSRHRYFDNFIGVCWGLSPHIVISPKSRVSICNARWTHRSLYSECVELELR